MRKLLFGLAGIVFMAAMLCACQGPATQAENPHADKTENIYAMGVKYTAENESTQAYLEIAQRSDALFALLEENADAFIMDAYNYQSIDEQGNMLYTQNTLSLPVEIDAGGHCIRVSRNYFSFNPIETADGEGIESRVIVDDNTLNLLIPEKHRAYEADIVSEYRALFYFEKITVANIYLEETGQPPLDTRMDELNINIIYVRDGQSYFTYRRDIAGNTGNTITDPIALIYTGNIHVSYIHSFMTQFAYFYSGESTPEAAYAAILPYIQQTNSEPSFQKVKSVKASFME